MRKAKIVIHCLLILFSFYTLKAENNIMYAKANQLYHNKNYDSAANLYQQLLNDGYHSSDLYYNTGNAYYRTNKIGLAIWCYEKALKCEANKNYSDNLNLAKRRIKEPIEEVKDIFFIRWWNSLYTFFSMNTWAMLSLCLFLSSLFLLFIKSLKRNIHFPTWLTTVFFMLSGFALMMTLVSAYQQNYHYQGIIIEPKTLFKFASKKDPIFISEGIKVEVVDAQHRQQSSGLADYILVKLPDGRTGQIDRKAMKKL